VAVLQLTNAKGEKTVHELVSREVVIGRAMTCDLVLAGTTVSRRHARVIKKPTGFYIEDLSSQHGTYLNDVLIEKRMLLEHGDRIVISGAILQFIASGAETVEELALSDQSSSIITVLDMERPATATSDANLKLKLRALLDITGLLGSTLDLKKIFPGMLDCIFDAFTQADAGSILLNVASKTGEKDPETGKRQRRLMPAATKSRDGGSDVKVSRTIAAQVMRQKHAVLSADATSDERFKASESVSSLEIRSVMCAPLLATGGEPIGMIHVSTGDTRRRFGSEDLELLVNLAGLAARVTEHSQLHETHLKFARRDYDLKMAKHLQMQFLPLKRPEIEEYQLFDFYQAAEGIGGDYFDYVPLPDGRVAIAIGDVAGKGVTAALLMARLCSDARYALTTSATLCEAVSKLNERIVAVSSQSRFATFAVCMLDPVKHEVTTVVAGHMPPLLRRSVTGSITSRGAAESGPPLGVSPGYEYQQSTIHLEPGDLVLLYTDGVSEMLNSSREQFGEERITQALKDTESSRNAVEGILQSVKEFGGRDTYNDDLCLLAFHRDSSLSHHRTIPNISALKTRPE